MGYDLAQQLSLNGCTKKNLLHLYGYWSGKGRLVLVREPAYVREESLNTISQGIGIREKLAANLSHIKKTLHYSHKVGACIQLASRVQTKGDFACEESREKNHPTFHQPMAFARWTGPSVVCNVRSTSLGGTQRNTCKHQNKKKTVSMSHPRSQLKLQCRYLKTTTKGLNGYSKTV